VSSGRRSICGIQDIIMNSKWKNPIRPALCASLFWFVGAGVIHAQVPAPMFKPAAAGFGSMTYVTLTDTGASLWGGRSCSMPLGIVEAVPVR
jgi:hypothetical protein